MFKERQGNTIHYTTRIQHDEKLKKGNFIQQKINTTQINTT